MRGKIAAILFVAPLAVSCSSLRPDSFGPVSSKPPASAILLTAPATVSDQTATDTFPAGKYRPRYEDRGGYYFEAPTKILVDDVAVFAYEGGIYLEKGATEPIRWYVIRPSGRRMGHFKKSPAYKLVP